MILVLPLNAALYIITWYTIRKSANRIRDVVGDNAQSIRACHDSAKIMTSFVLAYLVQWWGLAVYGIAEYFGHSNTSIYILVVTFSNLGGLFNGMVFVLTRKIRASSRINRQKTFESVHTERTQIDME